MSDEREQPDAPDRWSRLQDENARLRAALKEIQAYSVGDPKPRHTWYYDRAEAALNNQQTPRTSEVEK